MSKRVLHFQGRMGKGGAESFMMNMYREIDRSKIQFDFLIYDDYQDVTDYNEEIKDLGGRIFVVTNPKKNIIKYLFEVNKLLKREKFDIAHNEVYFGGGINLKLARRHGIKKRIAHSHATSDGKPTNLIMNQLRVFLDKMLKNNATDLLAVSKEAGESLFGDSRFTIIHNGIKISNYQFTIEQRKNKRKQMGLEESDFIIGNIGRLEEQKNQSRLLDILKNIREEKRNTKLLLIGEGSLREQLKNKITELDIKDSVVMTGERNDIPELLSIMDVFVMTSIYEGLPMVGLEAQASGKKLVLSSEISKDTKVTPNVKFVPLSASNHEWMNEILKAPFDNKLTSELETYDVSYTVKQMEQIYLK